MEKRRIVLCKIGHIAVYLVTNPLTWREGEGDLVVMETCI